MKKARSAKPLRVLYLGNNKLPSIQAFRYLLASGVKVLGVVPPPANRVSYGGITLQEVAKKARVPVFTEEALYSRSYKDVDVVFSFLFWNKIRQPILSMSRLGCINFHPAPLPAYRGVCGINFAIYEQLTTWGVSANMIDESFDTGDIVGTREFSIDPSTETAFSLEHKSLSHLLQLFKKVVDDLRRNKPLRRAPQSGGRYISRKDFEKMKLIQSTDTAADIERKIRACWYPPYAGATLQLQGQAFTLVSNDLIKEVAPFYHSKPVPAV